MIDTKRISGQMRELGLSSFQLAVAAGVRQPLVEGIMNGRCTDPEKLKAICDALDLDLDEITTTEKQS